VSSEPQAKVILCIDDYESVLECLRYFLESSGYVVLTAPSGRLGLQALSRNSVDAVILDYQMPEMNGDEVARKIREQGLTIPVIMFSGESTVPSNAFDVVDAFVPKACVDSLSVISELLDTLPVTITARDAGHSVAPAA
jgi:CheY-like chemotaxis protein